MKKTARRMRAVGSVLVCVVSLAAVGVSAEPAWDGPPSQREPGTFWRFHWFERGLTNGNPAYQGRFRVNAAEASLHPAYGRRVEARENGLMLIKAEEDLFAVTAAEFYCEAWGGHPGTANKRITVNGRNTYSLPRVGTEEGHCTYSYPAVPLRLTDLVNGYDAVQFALDQGTTFWGHMIVDNAAIRVALTNSHPDLVRFGLAEFNARVEVLPLGAPEGGAAGQGADPLPSEGYRVQLKLPKPAAEQVASVEYQGWYDGYDENGNRKGLDWHGFTKDRAPVATLGVSASPPFALAWDTRMLPSQRDVAIRAVIRFKADTNLVFLTAATTGLEIAERKGSRVVMFWPRDLPAPFWSRANQPKTCTLDLGVAPERIERAELHVVTWTGGAGTVKDYFTLNGVPYPVAEGERHELVYSRLPVNPKTLQAGHNRIELLSDTEHHGIEVMHPGPALVVRCR